MSDDLVAGQESAAPALAGDGDAAFDAHPAPGELVAAKEGSVPIAAWEEGLHERAEEPATGPRLHEEYRRFWLLIGAGWLGTNIAYSIYDLPMKLLLKNQLGLNAEAVALFFVIGQFTNYIKPLAGICTDAIPLFGTRRRHYLLFGLAACGVMWLAIAVIPPIYTVLLVTYSVMHVFIVFISTTLGGVMAEGGEKYRASGRLSAQRVGIFRIVGLIGGPLGGFLATKAFGFTCAAVAGFHFLLLPLFYLQLQEQRSARTDFHALAEVKRQWKALIGSRTLWSAAGLVFLVMVAPGLNTPLLYYQTNVLHFDPQFIGNLRVPTAIFGFVGALIFSQLCGRLPLRPLLAGGILLHVGAELLYLLYRDRTSAILVTGTYELAQTLAVLPLYDLAIRATPKGSEALGYSVMMSVWNLTGALSDLIGSALISRHIVTFQMLVCLNAFTTGLVLFAVPFLPRALTDRRDGDPLQDQAGEAHLAVAAPAEV